MSAMCFHIKLIFEGGITWYVIKGLVFICHGAAEHCLCYNELAENIKQKGYYVFAHDHVGHGQSQGDRVHIEDFSQYTRDVFHHIEMVKKRFSDKLPVFIIGHSMGGAISIVAAMEKPKYFTSVILIGPAIVGSPEAASPMKIFLGKIIAKIFPQMPVLKLDTKAISRDPEVVKKYEDDPLAYHGGLKASLSILMFKIDGRWGVALLKAMEQMEKGMESIEWSFFVLHGDQDRMCDVRGSKMLYEKAASKDKKLKSVFIDDFQEFLFYIKMYAFNFYVYKNEEKNYGTNLMFSEEKECYNAQFSVLPVDADLIFIFNI
ncbi:hypothetical protein KUTeg_020307 [Tegillarca granosa]|uniref:Serine aminopeptidase S33 domain-containing protein n=1 Tax=Tegillarca granosa TaxID=220873 RepID=A0ABQ9ECY7_TEGGR|nr:hypothetical protein KUTeg_020307 [Tegillarca granosa]